MGNVAEKIPHRFLGVGTNVVHILLHRIKSVVVDDCNFVRTDNEGPIY